MLNNIFITGATGYLGQRLAHHLAGKGHTIHALVRDQNKAMAILNHSSIKLFKGCILKKETIAKAMEGCDQVFHLAALATVWHKNPNAFKKTNMGGLKNVLEICVDKGIKDVLFTSTAGVVGHSTNGKPVAELTNSNPRLETLYEKSKLLAEDVALEYLSKGLRVVIVNPSRVYGPGLLTESNGFTRLMKMYLEGKWNIRPGNGKSIGNYVYIDDVIEGFELAMKKAHPGERYLLGGIDVSYNEFFDSISRLSGKHPKLHSIPLSVMLLASYLHLALAHTTGKHPLITPPFVRKYTKNWLVSSEKAKMELGYAITPLETGLAKTLSWLQSPAI